MTEAPLSTTVSDRGFDHHEPVPSEYGGNVRVYEASNAMYPAVWLKVVCPVDLNRPDGPTQEAVANLHVSNAWLVARQLAARVVDHYQDDGRPDQAVAGARQAMMQASGLCVTDADIMLERLAAQGYVLVNISESRT